MMGRFLVVGLLLAGLLACSERRDALLEASAPPRCAAEPIDPATSADAYDQGQTGWRALASKRCYAEAAMQIASILDRGAPSAPDAVRRSLEWHEGQMWAAAGDYGRARRHFVDADRSLLASLGRKPDDIGRDIYERATIAFVSRDGAGVMRARAAMLAMPEPSWFKDASDRFQARFKQTPPKWPPNGLEVYRLAACFAYPYERAYKGDCPDAPH